MTANAIGRVTATSEHWGGAITVTASSPGAGRPIGLRHMVPAVMSNRRGYRRHPIFRDPSVQGGLARDGYHIADAVLPPEGIAALLEACAAWQEMCPAPADGSFHFSGARPPTPASTFARSRIAEVLVPAVSRLVDLGRGRVGPSVFQVKPSSPHSGVRSHQDPFVVDERTSFGVSVWTALTKVDVEDGAIIVLPGSHRYARWKRVATTTDDLDGFHEVIERHARAIILRPGQALFFDHALIHGSLVNRSGATRIGASAVVVPRACDLTIPAPVDGPSPGSTDLYRMEVDRATGATPPTLTDGEHLGHIRLDHLAVSRRGLDAVCRLQHALRPGSPGLPIPSGISTA